MALRPYDKEITKEYIPSGVESPDTKGEEMQVIKPFIKNERGEYRAVDLKSGWKGWVDYIPPAPTPTPIPQPTPPTPEEGATLAYNEKKEELVRAKYDLDLGIIDQAEYDTLLDEVKSLRV